MSATTKTEMATDGTVLCEEGQSWVCAACGKTSRSRYGFDKDGTSVADRGWDESCMMNAVLCRPASEREKRASRMPWVAVVLLALLGACAVPDPPPALSIEEAIDDELYAWGSGRCIVERDQLEITTDMSYCPDTAGGCMYYLSLPDVEPWPVIALRRRAYFDDELERLTRHETAHWLIACNGQGYDVDPEHKLPLWKRYR